MAEKKSVKRKVITAVVIIGVFALLIGSFFLRDVCLRAGITECEKREILQVKSKYSSIRLQPLTADFLKNRSYRLMKTASRFMIS